VTGTGLGNQATIKENEMFGDFIITSLLHNPIDALTTLFFGLAATVLLHKMFKYLLFGGAGIAVFMLLGQTR
jgi:hypothetical protein